MAPRGPGFLPAVILTAAVLILVIAHGLSSDGGLARADGGGMDAMSVDMDPAGNTATSIGPREFCARVDRNGAMDGDEDVVDGLTIDVTAGPLGIPADSPMIAFTFRLAYDAGLLAVVAEGVGFLLAAAPGSDLMPVSDALPESDGVFNSTAVDFSVDITGAAESGPGVLTRITIVPANDAPAGVRHLVLLGGEAAHVNTEGMGSAPEALNHGMLAIDVECPDVQPTPGPVITMTPRPTPTRTQGPTPPPRSPPTNRPTSTPTLSPGPSITQGPMPAVVTLAAPASLPRGGGGSGAGGGPSATTTGLVLLSFVGAIMALGFWTRSREPGKDDGK